MLILKQYSIHMPLKLHQHIVILQTLICKVIYWKEKTHGQYAVSNNFPKVGEGCFGLSHNDPGDGANQAGIFPSWEYPGMVKVGSCILIFKLQHCCVQG